MFFKQVSTLGLFCLFAVILLGFVLECFAATSSWNKVSLTTCSQVSGPTTTKLQDIKLYLQPNSGICQVANAVSSSEGDCKLFTDTAFWTTWDIVANTGSSATEAAATIIPKIYSLTVASIFFSLFSVLAIVFHYLKPDSMSRFITQGLVGIFQLLVAVFMVYTPTAAGTNVLSSADDWKAYYQTLSITWESAASTQYIGGGCALMAFTCALLSLALALLPTCCGTCFYCVEEGGSGTGGGDSTGIKSSLVDNDDSQSNYVPPVV
jgi:hypothetical protein